MSVLNQRKMYSHTFKCKTKLKMARCIVTQDNDEKYEQNP